MGTDIHYIIIKDKEELLVDLDISRHYLLFAVLAGVRNRWIGLEPISKNLRGIHPDSKTLFNEEGWEYYHSKSYLSSTEILEWFLTDRVIYDTGIVTIDDYLNWDGIYPFQVYSQSVSGPGIRFYDAKFNDSVDSSLLQELTHIRVYWKKSISSSLEYFRSQIENIHEEHGEFTLCFGFDS